MVGRPPWMALHARLVGSFVDAARWRTRREKKKEGETNVCLSDDENDDDMTNSDSSSAWILTEFTHVAHSCAVHRSQERERERERERGADSIPSGIQSDVKSPASSSSPPTSWWTKPPPSRPPSPPPLERGDLNDRKHARITGGSGTRPPLYLARFKVGETNREFPKKRAAAADKRIG